MPLRLHLSALVLITASAVVPATAALVDVSDLFNTGVDASKVALGDDALDPHYTFALPPPTGTVPVVANSATGFPIPPWLGDSAVSAWLTPSADTTGNIGQYVYRTQFTVPAGVNPANVFINGAWASDNEGLNILINGAPTGIVNSTGFGAFSPVWSVQKGFVTGVNTLDFVVNEATGSAGAGGFTGVRVEMTGKHAAAGRVGIPGLINSGVAAAEGAPLPEDTVVPNVTLAPGSAVVGPVFVATAAGGFPIPPWIGDSIDSAWIVPSLDTNAAPGDYLYQLPFDLTGLDPATVEIYGRWASDDGGPDILLNGLATGNQPAAGFSSWTDFTLSAATGETFSPGINTLTFQVNNGGVDVNPSGLRFEFLSATALAIPEPSALGLLALAAAAAARRRRRRAA